MSSRGDPASSGLYRGDATKRRGHTQGACQVAPDCELHHAGSHGSSRAPGAAARGARQVVRVVGPPVDSVEASKVKAACRHVGLANDFCAVQPQPRNERRICPNWAAVFAIFKPAHCRHAQDVDGVLNQHGDAAQNCAGTFGAISCAAARQRLNCVHDRVQIPVHRLDPAQRSLHARVQQSPSEHGFARTRRSA